MLQDRDFQKVIGFINENGCSPVRNVVREISHGNLPLTPRSLSNHLRPAIKQGLLARMYVRGTPYLFIPGKL